jgi:hypothetical protein
LSLLKTLTLPTFSKLAATLPKKIFGSQNHFWQLAQAELVEFISDTKSLAAKTNFGRILPKIFGTANFYFDFFSAFHFVLQRVTFKLNKRQHTCTTHHTTKNGSAQQPRCSGSGGGAAAAPAGGGAAASLCSVCVGAGPLTRWRQPKTTIDARSPAAAPAGGGSGAGSGR